MGLIRWSCRIGLWALVFMGLGLCLMAITPQGRVAWKVALLIPELIPSSPVTPQKWFTQSPLREEVQLQASESTQLADLYLPAGEGQHSAVLLFLGVNPAGRDDPRVVGLAEGLARSGMIVMVPWSEHMAQKRLRPEDIRGLVSAFQFLRDHPRVDPRRVGMGGFCVGASFALVAAADPTIRDMVHFVNFFGGYFDPIDLLTAVASQTSFYGDREKHWQPNPLTRQVFAHHLLAMVQNSTERDLLGEIYASGDLAAREAPPDISPEGKIVWDLLGGLPLAQARTLSSDLPQELKELLYQISPRVAIGQLKARVFIMHDRQDTLVPVEESRRLRDTLESQGANLSYAEFTFFQHMDPTRPVAFLTFVRDIAHLFVHMYNVLRVTS